MTTVLEVQSLTKGFTMHHLGNHLAAFDQISFDLMAGEFLLLKGQNGAGKSTLLRTLYRSYVAQAGKVIFHSEHGAIDLLSAADVDITSDLTLELLALEEIGGGLEGGVLLGGRGDGERGGRGLGATGEFGDGRRGVGHEAPA